MSTQSELYPLTFEPIYKEKVWGGRSFETLGRDLPGTDANGIGESWEIADLATTSVSGGGGNAEYSVVANGPLKGQSIRELMQTYGEAVLGKGVQPSDDGGFPLLIKFLDAKENLSVQVHPSPEYAAAHEDAYLKSEAWYIIDHEPGAVIYKGLAPGTTPEMLRAALEANTDEAVVPLLNAIEVKKGDCHYLPSGTLHALGAGVLVAEVQTPSDTTYRVYDWGRTDRELHIEQAMACIDFTDQDEVAEARGNAEQIESGVSLTHLAKCKHFLIDEITFDSPAEYKGLAGESPNMLSIWIAIEGSGRFTSDSGNDVEVNPGNTIMLPASYWPHVQSNDAGGRWLQVKLP